jgi:hypothetical protein
MNLIAQRGLLSENGECKGETQQKKYSIHSTKINFEEINLPKS